MSDLDRLKSINDQHDHPAGDVMFYTIAGRSRTLARD